MAGSWGGVKVAQQLQQNIPPQSLTQVGNTGGYQAPVAQPSADGRAVIGYQPGTSTWGSPGVPIYAPTPQTGGQGGANPLTPDSFGQTQFSNPNAMPWLMQQLGFGGQTPSGTSQPTSATQQPSPLTAFGGMDFSSLFKNLLGKFNTPDSSAPTPAPTGPAPNPLSSLNSYAGPFGNGGGYLQPRSTIQPVTIKTPRAIG
jgi:hypothetical protein